ncbi:MAG TPA: SBBP repeat-containing protein, partial [Chitinophagales bacterium]|nr:SBBP repeat-containing protein [Chitinophagales bacterium]
MFRLFASFICAFCLFFLNCSYAQTPMLNWANSTSKGWTQSSSFSEAYAIARDNAGNVYVAGSTQGVIDFDPGPGTAFLNFGSSGLIPNTFIAKYNPNGAYLWATGLVTYSSVSPKKYGLAVDGNGNAFLVGSFSS